MSLFGTKYILIKVSTRVSLGVVMKNSLGQDQKQSLLKLYDKIWTCLRSLKMLCVWNENYALYL